ncbi:MAG: hypothetical protein U0Z17_05310 [Bacteroidales bacterium]
MEGVKVEASIKIKKIQNPTGISQGVELNVAYHGLANAKILMDAVNTGKPITTLSK